MRERHKRFVPRSRKAAVFAAMLTALLLAAPAGRGALTEPRRDPSWPAPASKSVPSEASALEEAFTGVAERVGPAVVSVEASYTIVQRFSPWGGDQFFDDFFRRFFEQPPGGYEQRQPVRSLGSGVIISHDGLILTNAHVIGEAKNITVRLLNKKEYKAKIVGKDEDTDLAVLKIDAEANLAAAPLGDSDKIKVGQWAIAIGNPFALENTVTVGVISAKGRQLDPSTGSAARYTSFIQTDASINRGNSGGPLLNLRGEVVGINTMIYSNSGGSIGIGFAIPSNVAKRILDGIVKEGRFVRPQMGIMYGPVSPAVAKKLGLEPGTGMEVTNVLKGTAADAAGIRPSDIILRVDEKELHQVEDLRGTILNHQVGDTMTVEIFRKGKKLTVTVILKEEQKPAEEKSPGKKSAKKASEAGTKWLGLTVIELTDELARELGARDSQGVVVAQVDADSPAAETGLQRGDIIREVEQRPVTNMTEFRQTTKRAKDKEGGVLLLIERHGATSYMVINPSGGGAGE